jgi:hypothetical protein
MNNQRISDNDLLDEDQTYQLEVNVWKTETAAPVSV